MVRIASIMLALGIASGCYRSHGRPDGAGERDAGRTDAGRIDAGRIDAGPIDAGMPACCIRWTHAARAEVPGFVEGTVTPRLLALGGEPAVVVTGPSDPVGPSGAHLVRFDRSLGSFTSPVAVTRGSFTWGQPASDGVRIAVCWGVGGEGLAVRVFDARGNPSSAQARLDDMARSPCIDGAISGDVAAFVFVIGDAESAGVRVRGVHLGTGEVGAAFDLEIADERAGASLVGTRDGFVLVVPGEPTRAIGLDRGLRRIVDADLGSARRVRAVSLADALAIVRTFERATPRGTLEEVWTHETLALPALSPRTMAREISVVEPAPGPRFAAAADPCGGLALGTTSPSLSHVTTSGGEPRLHEYLPDGTTGPIIGDTSVLVLDRDAYVAFSVGSLTRAVTIDHWRCDEP